jgi:anti-sigma28 factor (negative regulator of flagellin synthesis)
VGFNGSAFSGYETMSMMLNIDNVRSILPPLRAIHRPSLTPHASAPTGERDRVELSSAERTSEQPADGSALRVERIEFLRSEIAAGTYETPERIAGTVSRLLDVIG